MVRCSSCGQNEKKIPLRPRHGPPAVFETVYLVCAYRSRASKSNALVEVYSRTMFTLDLGAACACRSVCGVCMMGDLVSVPAAAITKSPELTSPDGCQGTLSVL